MCAGPYLQTFTNVTS